MIVAGRPVMTTGALAIGSLMLVITFPVTVMDVGTPVDELESLLHPGKAARRNDYCPQDSEDNRETCAWHGWTSNQVGYPATELFGSTGM